MAARKTWCPDRRNMIWIDCNPQAGREMKDVHPGTEPVTSSAISRPFVVWRVPAFSLWGLMQGRIEQVLVFELGRVARFLTPHRLQAR
jgi:hypothetical protein